MAHRQHFEDFTIRFDELHVARKHAAVEAPHERVPPLDRTRIRRGHVREVVEPQRLPGFAVGEQLLEHVDGHLDGFEALAQVAEHGVSRSAGSESRAAMRAMASSSVRVPQSKLVQSS
jgi:hypothetical protein